MVMAMVIVIVIVIVIIIAFKRDRGKREKVASKQAVYLERKLRTLISLAISLFSEIKRDLFAVV